MARMYWLDLFTLETWNEFLRHGADVTGFTEKRWKAVQRMQPGDYLLCYLTHYSRWIGVLEVTGPAFQDDTPIWSSKPFSSRVPVRVIVSVLPEYGVPVLNMRSDLSVFQGISNPNRWSGPFRGSPAEWKRRDGEAVLRRLQEAKERPEHRPLDKRGRRGDPMQRQLSVETDDGEVTIPQDEEATADPGSARPDLTHLEIQYQLLKLGSDMGLDVHVASNDRSQVYAGGRLSDIPRMRKSLPQQFDPAVSKIIQLIDVLWLDGDAIVAAFEVERTTSIYSGLLRMSDLISVLPNISIPLFLVAPEERRERVIAHINRPTFARMKPPLAEICRFIPFEGLTDSMERFSDVVSHLKPDVLQSISESCEADR